MKGGFGGIREKGEAEGRAEVTEGGVEGGTEGGTEEETEKGMEIWAKKVSEGGREGGRSYLGGLQLASRKPIASDTQLPSHHTHSYHSCSSKRTAFCYPLCTCGIGPHPPIVVAVQHISVQQHVIPSHPLGRSLCSCEMTHSSSIATIGMSCRVCAVDTVDSA